MEKKITTKFNVGDTVYAMFNGLAHTGRIIYVEVRYRVMEPTEYTEVTYTVALTTGNVTTDKEFTEEEIFKTKDDLVNRILSTIN